MAARGDGHLLTVATAASETSTACARPETSICLRVHTLTYDHGTP
ncbi:MAG TPA: hypothetical protein VGP02_11145 [Mycobacteriales bacterium]|jgi:hypothetical protein|nr:hypothetical protein [Mycobacteriales bacterium]